MKLKLTYARESGVSADIVVTFDAMATVGDIARELISTDPVTLSRATSTEMTLSVSAPEATVFETLPSDRAVGEVAVASGYTVRVVPAGANSTDSLAGGVKASAVMRVVEGPDAGTEFPLVDGTHLIGRDQLADITLNDDFVSKRHARINVGNQIELVDLNSANGLLVDGGIVPRLVVQPNQTVTLGDSVVAFDQVARTTVAGESVPEIHGASVPFNRSPKVEVRYPGREFPRPDVPGEMDKPPFPWLVMVAPIVIGVLMFVVTKRPASLLFVAMSPMMMIANFTMSAKRGRRQHDSAVRRFSEQLTDLEQKLTDELPRERELRQAEAPSVSEVYTGASQLDCLLWTRRPEHWSFLLLRLGLGRAPSRNTVAAAGDRADGLPEFSHLLDDAIARFGEIDEVPIVENPLVAGALGVVGSNEHTEDVARALLIQLTGMHSPAELVVTAISGPDGPQEFGWLNWLPHTSSPHSPIEGVHLADSAATGATLLARLEELIESRLGRNADASPEARGALALDDGAINDGAKVGTEPADGPPPTPVVVVLVTDDAPVDRARLVQMTERAASAGILPIWTAASAARLPGACRTFVDLSRGLEDAEVHFVRLGVLSTGVFVEGVSRDHAAVFARRIAPVVDSGALVSDSSDLPTTVSMLSLIGPELASSTSAVLDRWQQNHSVIDRSGVARPTARTGSLRALVGQAGQDAMHLDLRAQGPHALVGGTTGSGKSEFLQAWVLGMAAEYSPDRVTFLFVDYKGGSAFADCVALPHFVGLVTDLTPHLVRRALTSLRAELQSREHLFNVKKAKDLIELEKRGDPDCPPALIIVIDEFAALANDVPEFVDGVVDIAQRGRSLGIHLIMATQRPAGVIKDNLRANTNLRIALRMADEMDSSDVVGSPVAAGFDPGLPGRGIAKTGPGRLAPFQSAYAGGWTSEEVPDPSVQVATLRFGAEVIWERPADATIDEVTEPGPTDQTRLVTTLSRAADEGEIPRPRRPWLNELSAAYDLQLMAPRTDKEIVFGVSDRPDQQRQDSMYFEPDVDGNFAVFGTGGSGKTVFLRTLAAAAGITPRGGPVDVYALDFAAGGLKMLEVLPHVSSVISGEDSERVVRLMRQLRQTADLRAGAYSAVNAGNISDYRSLASLPDEPRILLLVDGFPAFRADYEGQGSRSQSYATFLQLLAEGRQLGIHIVLTADRPSSVPGAVLSAAPRRLGLRMADETMYTWLGMPQDVVTAKSPGGRGIVDDVETQIAILGGSGNVADQSKALAQLAAAMVRSGRQTVAPVRSLPTEVSLADLPVAVDGRPTLGISDVDLEPVGFEPSGVFLVGGGPSSGRSNAVRAMVQSVMRWDPQCAPFYLGNRRSGLGVEDFWTDAAYSPEDVAALAKRLAKLAATKDEPRLVVVVEALADFNSTPTDAAIVEMTRAIKRSDHLLIAESETSTWASSYAIFAEIKAARRGVLLQPETIEGDTILRTTFPRVVRAEFPVGRGLAVDGGKVVRLQLPIPT